MSAPADASLLEFARAAQAIAQNGLTFTRDPFDRERYTQLAELVTALLSAQLQIPATTARAFWDGERGYATPKVDVRGGIFDGERVLLVRERSDGCRHPHPPGVHHIYKLFFICELTGGAPATGNETDAVEFFELQALPPLSRGRVLASQIERLYRHRLEPALPTDFD
jgi:hypothetical protein